MIRLALPLAALLLAAPALAQDPANPATPDGTRPAPIEIVMGMVDGAPACAPDALRMPVDNMVVLLLKNGGGGTMDFTAPDLFEASEIADREGGQAWITQEGALLARVPAAGEVEIALTAMEPGIYTFACLEPGNAENRFEGVIEAVPTPSDG